MSSRIIQPTSYSRTDHLRPPDPNHLLHSRYAKNIITSSSICSLPPVKHSLTLAHEFRFRPHWELLCPRCKMAPASNPGGLNIRQGLDLLGASRGRHFMQYPRCAVIPHFPLYSTSEVRSMAVFVVSSLCGDTTLVIRVLLVLSGSDD